MTVLISTKNCASGNVLGVMDLSTYKYLKDGVIM